MYCGSCLRDNRLAATLIEQGRDVVLIPLYTPIRTDETDVSQRRVLFGGINIYLRQKSALFRMFPGWMTRMLDAPVLLRMALRLAGEHHTDAVGALTVAMLRGEEGPLRSELDRLIASLRPLKPDLINLPNLLFAGLARRLRAELGASVVCTLSGEDLFIDQLPATYAAQTDELIRQRAADVDGFLSPTSYYAHYATERFSLGDAKVHHTPLGIRTGDFADPDSATWREQNDDRPFTIGYLARICPEKGLARLCDAFAILRRQGRKCRVRAAGYLGAADKKYLERVLDELRQRSIDDGFEYVGSVSREEKAKFLRSLDVFSVPTEYREAKGLFVLEAMASGVPVVQPDHGSFRELVGATGGGLLYDPGDAEALAGAIARLMDDQQLRRQLGHSGRAAVQTDFTDKVMAEATWSVYRQYAGKRSVGRDAND